MKLLYSVAAFEGNNTKFVWNEVSKSANEQETKVEVTKKTHGELDKVKTEVEQISLTPKERVEKKFDDLKKVFGIKGILFSQNKNSVYNYEKLEKEGIPTLFRVLMQLKKERPEVIKALETVPLFANAEYPIDWAALDSKKHIVFNYVDSVEEISKYIVSDLIAMRKIKS